MKTDSELKWVGFQFVFKLVRGAIAEGGVATVEVEVGVEVMGDFQPRFFERGKDGARQQQFIFKCAPARLDVGVVVGIALPTEATAATATGLHAWPTELAQQMQVLRDALQQAARPLSTVQLAAGFRRVRPEKVEPLLATLAALSLVRQTAEGAYVA